MRTNTATRSRSFQSPAVAAVAVAAVVAVDAVNFDVVAVVDVHSSANGSAVRDSRNDYGERNDLATLVDR